MALVPARAGGAFAIAPKAGEAAPPSAGAIAGQGEAPPFAVHVRPPVVAVVHATEVAVVAVGLEVAATSHTEAACREAPKVPSVTVGRLHCLSIVSGRPLISVRPEKRGTNLYLGQGPGVPDTEPTAQWPGVPRARAFCFGPGVRGANVYPPTPHPALSLPTQ